MSRRRKTLTSTPPRPRCVLDSGGLTALIGGSQDARAWLRWLVDHDGEIVIPTPVLVESTTGDGARDAEVNRVLAVLQRAADVLQAPDEATARRADALRFRATTDDGIDALVAAVAAGQGSPTLLLTSDPRDLERLLQDDDHVSVRRV